MCTKLADFADRRFLPIEPTLPILPIEAKFADFADWSQVSILPIEAKFTDFADSIIKWPPADFTDWLPI